MFGLVRLLNEDSMVAAENGIVEKKTWLGQPDTLLENSIFSDRVGGCTRLFFTMYVQRIFWRKIYLRTSR